MLSRQRNAFPRSFQIHGGRSTMSIFPKPIAWSKCLMMSKCVAKNNNNNKKNPATHTSIYLQKAKQTCTANHFVYSLKKRKEKTSEAIVFFL